MTTPEGWTISQAEDCAIRAKLRAGDERGWSLLGKELQTGLICSEVLTTICKGAGVVDSVRVAHIQKLVWDALDAGGIES